MMHSACYSASTPTRVPDSTLHSLRVFKFVSVGEGATLYVYTPYSRIAESMPIPGEVRAGTPIHCLYEHSHVKSTSGLHLYLYYPVGVIHPPLQC